MVVRESDAVDEVSIGFCNSVGAIDMGQVPCHQTISKLLRENFRYRLQNDLLFEMKVVNAKGISKIFYYFKDDEIDNAIMSFFKRKH